MASYLPRLLASLFLALLLAGSATGLPPGWESDYGAEVAGLTGQDDDSVNVVLSFDFPFAGTSYSVVSINNNGAVAFGNDPQVVHDVHWHVWHKSAFEADFTDAGFPSLLAFNTDLDQTTVGTVYFNDLGDRAVVTWDGVGTDRTPAENLATFQLKLAADGSFRYEYRDFAGDLIGDLDEGIVVGYSDGAGEPTPGSIDYTDAPMSTLVTAYELWCMDEDPAADPNASDCFEPGRDNNSGFDLFDKSLVFQPDGTGGYLVEVELPPPPTPAPQTVTPSGGGAHSPAGLMLLILFGWLRRRSAGPATAPG